MISFPPYFIIIPKSLQYLRIFLCTPSKQCKTTSLCRSSYSALRLLHAVKMNSRAKWRRKMKIKLRPVAKFMTFFSATSPVNSNSAAVKSASSPKNFASGCGRRRSNFPGKPHTPRVDTMKNLKSNLRICDPKNQLFERFAF